MILHIDIETYSDVDISKAGVYAYTESPAFEVLLIAYCVDDGPVCVEDLTEDLGLDPRLLELITDPGVIKMAYNANFERTALARFFGRSMPPEQWHCTMVHASMLGLPRSLAAVGKAIGLPEDEQKARIGKSLIQYFCKPCKATKTNGGRQRNLPEDAPEKWEQFKEYCRQDVVTEKAIHDRLKIYPVPDSEQHLWELDQRINDRGIRLDVPMVEKILAYDKTSQERLKNEAARISGLENPNSLQQLKRWFLERCGVAVSSITKDNMPELEKDLAGHRDALRLLRIRQELGKTSTKKYDAMLAAVCEDGRLRGTLQFYGGSRTGRWAGRIVQVHNLPQNHIPDLDLARKLAADSQFEDLEMLFGPSAFVFSQLIRTALIPSAGCRFVVADFSAIEARVTAYLAGEQWRLDVFRSHGKIYEASAAQMFHVPIESVTKGSKLRQQGKVAELALGYGGAVGAIKAMDKAGSIPDDEIPMLVANWRKANPAICKFWRTCDAGAKTAIREHRSVKLANGIRFSYANKILFITLLSGRKIAYYDARIETTDDGEEEITYSGIEQQSKTWGRQKTWGGKLVENIVQATARDCLAVTLQRVDAAGFDIVMHVHDELICDVPVGQMDALQTLTGIMAEEIPWAPGLPLRGDGFEAAFYKKD